MRSLLSAVLIALLIFPAVADDGRGDYVLGPDDIIEISVTGHDDLRRQLQIRPDGKIAFPEVGEIVAAGKTPAALAAALKEALEQHRNNVQVVVSVVNPRSQRVRVVGAVKSPGVYDYRRGMRALDLVAMAGGLSTRAARVRARVLGANGSVREFNLQEAIQRPDSEANAVLNVDDLLLLDEADPLQNKAYVLGRVARPGAYELGDEGRSLLAILAEAGNPTEDAALSRCTILRGSNEIVVNLLPALAQGKMDDPARQVMLQPGDMVFVPRNEAIVSVMGSVVKAGQYALSEQRPTTLLDALGLAGGPSQSANTREVSLIRMVEGKPEVTLINLDEIVKKRKYALNVPLQQGDIVFVPAKGEKGFRMSDIVAPFSALYYLLQIAR